MKFFIVISLILYLGGCSTAPSSDADFEEGPKGPGMFSGKDGYISLSGLLSGDKKADAGKEKTSAGHSSVPVASSANSNSSTSINSSTNEEEFEIYKIWLRTKNANTESYQEFQEWRSYQEFLRRKNK
ncbi:MAG: hypothetical protein ACRBBR_02250 [Cellvibrionaceae bacterium]